MLPWHVHTFKRLTKSLKKNEKSECDLEKGVVGATFELWNLNVISESRNVFVQITIKIIEIAIFRFFHVFRKKIHCYYTVRRVSSQLFLTIYLRFNFRVDSFSY